MEKGGQFKSNDIKIQGLIDQYLRLKASVNGLAENEAHLDEDSLTALIESNLGQIEVQSIVNHLIDCTFCRHKTAELVKLEMAFADEETKFAVSENQPAKISEVLSGLLSRLFDNNEKAVFAHQEKEEETKDQKNLEEKE